MNIAGISIISVIILIIGLVIYLKKRFRAALTEVEAEYPEHDRLLTCPMANFFGLKSLGMKQMRGNGILLLTSSRMYFRMLAPKREVMIPLESILSVETPVSFLGKTRGMKLLQVNFRNQQGQMDSAAWITSDLQRWVEVLEQAAALH